VSVYKRAGKYWAYSVRDSSGQRIQKQGFRTKKDAENELADILSDLNKGTHTSHRESITLDQAAQNWIVHAEANGREQTTILQYRQHARHITDAKIGKLRFGDIKLSDLRRTTVAKFRDQFMKAPAHEKGKTNSRALSQKVMVSLRSILRQAANDGFVAQNVAADVKIAKDNGRQKERVEEGKHFPSVAEVRETIKSLTSSPHNSDDQRRQADFHHAIYVTLAFSGLRVSEVRGLRWRDVFIDHLEVRQRADRFNKIGPCKSKHSVRDVSVMPLVANAIARLGRGKPDDLIFGTGTDQPLDYFVMAEWPEFKKYGIHALRHFHASWCLSAKPAGLGLGLKQVQARLGHSTIVLTADTYGHLLKVDESDAMAEAERAFLRSA
jgi:integrase